MVWLRVLLCVFLTGPLVAFANDLPDLIARIKPSIVGVGVAYPPRQPIFRGDRARYMGTGFVVQDGLTVVTNAHVLPAGVDAPSRELIAVFVGQGKNATARPAQLLAEDKDLDLAVLRFEGPPLPALSLGDSGKVREGDSVAFTGYPLGEAMGLTPVTHRGIVSAITPMVPPASRAGELTALHVSRARKGLMAFQLDATAYPGNSGSPVYNDLGEVIGVLNSVVVKETRENLLTQPSGISYAIPSRHIVTLLAGLSVP